MTDSAAAHDIKVSALTSKTESQEQKEWEEEQKIRSAALYITEGEKKVFLRHPKDEDGVLSFYIIHNPVYYITHLVSTILLMLLALVEEPGVFPMEEWSTIVIHVPLEVILLLFLIVDVTLKAIWLRKKFFTHRTFWIAVFVVVMFVETVVVIIRHQSHIRVLRALRPLFFIDSYLMSETRRTLRNIGKCLTEILDVLLVLLFMIAVFALTEMDPDYFSTVGQSYVSLFVTLTTANHPDVMMEAYAFDGWSALFFIIFLVITLYLLTSVLLGVVYSSFTDASQHKFEKKFKRQRNVLKKAYDQITENGHALDVDTFIKLMLEYKPLMSKWKVLCTFKALKIMNARRNGSTQPSNPENDSHFIPQTAEEPTVEKLTAEEFQNFYEALDFKWNPQNKKESEGLQHWYWLLSVRDHFGKLSTFVDSRYFKITITIVVIANTLFLIIYTALSVSNVNQRYEVMHGVLWVSFLFVTVYCVEAILKIIAFGYKYFTKFSNLVDFVIIIGSLVMLFAEINPTYYVLLAFRPVKLIRLLWLKRRYRNIIKALMLLKQKIIAAIILLLVVYYFFAITGMEAFSEIVKHKCCDYNHSWYGVGEYYSGSHSISTTNIYWLLNFDNILRSFNTLFVLMVVNNWYIIMEGFAAEVQQQTSVHLAWLTRLYFMSFYIITLVVLQVNVTFIVDAFANARKINEQMSKSSRNRITVKKHQQNNSNSDPDSATEQKSSIVEAYYDPLKIWISREEVDQAPEQYPRKWWQSIAYHIRVWRSVDFARYKCVENGNYRFTGERRRDKHCLNIQLYSDKIPDWEKQCKKIPRSCGDLFLSVCCHMCTQVCCHKCAKEKSNKDITCAKEKSTKHVKDKVEVYTCTVKFLEKLVEFLFE